MQNYREFFLPHLMAKKQWIVLVVMLNDLYGEQLKLARIISDASEYRVSSNKRSPLISATLSGVPIEISAYPVIIAALLNAALIRTVTIFY